MTPRRRMQIFPVVDLQDWGDPIKPELAAPGVNIITARAGGGYEAVTGTSFAAPFVTGSAALMMQWGIVKWERSLSVWGEK